jgi:chemotaxis protein CheX
MGDEKQQKELICQVFIDSVNNYFEEVTGIKSETGLPYLKDDKQQVLAHYTGMIGISGSRRGFVYVTGPKELFNDLVKIILDIDKPNDDQIVDMAGEVANTVSGNVRKAFGSEFMISVPAIIQGKPEDLKMQKDVPVFVIPIKWREYKAYVVIGLE